MSAPETSEEPVYRITLVRHGESVGNTEGRLQGHADYPLSERGRAQIVALAHRWTAGAITFDQVIASPLSRALESARILAAELKTAEPEIDPRWIEQDVGEDAGMRWDEIHRRGLALDGVEAADPSAAWAETESALRHRASEALCSILQRSPARYLVISHRALLNMVLFAILGVAAQPDGHRRTNFRIANGAFSRVRYYPRTDQWQVDVIGDRAHWDDG